MAELKEILFLSEDFLQRRINSAVFRCSSRKDAVDALRTIYWYHYVAGQTGDRSSYALEKRFDPNSFHKNEDGVVSYRHKWQRYAKGDVVPNQSTIDRVDELCRGANGQINHVLWEALRPDCHVTPYADDWLKRLDPSIQTAIFHIEHKGLEVVYHLQKVGRRLLDKIAHRASLDALACLTILCRKAVEADQQQQAFEIAIEIHWLLVLLGIELQGRRIAKELIKLYEQRIFSLIHWKGLRLYPEQVDYAEASTLLNILPYTRPENRGKDLTWVERVSSMRNYIRGNDFGVRFGLTIIYGPDPLYALSNSNEQRDFEQRKRLQAWGLASLRSGRKVAFPPFEIWARN